jgi:hypothetical protein
MFAHGSAWARVLHETYKFTPVYFVGDNGSTSRLLATMEVNSALTGRRGVSLPFTDECEILSSSLSDACHLFREATEYASFRGWKYLEFRGGRNWFPQVAPSTTFFGHQLALRSGTLQLLANLDSSTRTSIRKAERENVVVEFSQSMGAMLCFYDLLCKTRKRLGVPPQPRRFFEAIHRCIIERNLGVIVLAKSGLSTIAGAVFFHFNNTALFKFGASNPSYQHLRSNNLLMWRAIEWYGKRGFTSLDFGRTSVVNEGLRRFKLGWGSYERAIKYAQYDFTTGDFVIAPDDSSGWHTRLFRLIPRTLARPIGSIVYPHVA